MTQASTKLGDSRSLNPDLRAPHLCCASHRAQSANCIIAEWSDMDALAKARPAMIAYVDAMI
jgi:hypothetical protein